MNVDGTDEPNRVITLSEDLEKRALKFINDNRKTFEQLADEKENLK